MKYTIKDIAQLCQVGKSTVSRVLNDDPNVNPATRERIQAVIKSLNFQPNRSARAMRGSREPVVGIIVTRLNSAAESQTLSAILPALYRQQITPIIVESQFQPALVSRHFKLFRERQVNGVILFGFSQLSHAVLNEWQHHLVTVARPYPNISAVFYDDAHAVKLLMQRFYQQGHREIAYLGVNDDDETTGKLRNQSYLQFCEQHHLSPNLVKTPLGADNAYRNAPQLFRQPVSAIVCASSSLTIGCLKYLQETQQNRPLATIGRNELLDYLIPDLISLDFGYQQAGKWAVELLLKQLQGDTEIEQRKVPLALLD